MTQTTHYNTHVKLIKSKEQIVDLFAGGWDRAHVLGELRAVGIRVRPGDGLGQEILDVWQLEGAPKLPSIRTLVQAKEGLLSGEPKAMQLIKDLRIQPGLFGKLMRVWIYERALKLEL